MSIKINKEIAVSDTGFVFNPITGESFTVNPIGQEIIDYLKEGKAVEEIQNRLLEKYETDPSTIEKDMDDFLDMLKRYSLVED